MLTTLRRLARRCLCACGWHKRVKFLFAWYDIWIGIYWDRRNRRLYILPVPMLGVVIDCCRHDWKLQRYYTRDNDYKEVARCKRCGTESDVPF